MIHVKIGSSERTLQNADPSRINEQINRRRHDGQSICVRVQIDDDLANMILSTPTCDGSGGGNRPPNPQESEIFALWNKNGLNKNEFSSENLGAFLKQLIRVISV